MEVFTLFGKLSLDASGFKSDLSAAEGHVSGFRDKVGSIFAKVGAVIAGAFAVSKIVDFAKDSIAAFSDFEAKVTKMFATMDPLPDDVKAQLLQDIEDISEQYGILAGSVVDAFDLVGDLGVPVEDLDEFMQHAAQLSKVLGIDLDTAAESLAKTVQGLGGDFSTAGEVANTFFTVAEAGNVDIGTLQTTFAKLLPLAQDAGVSMEELAGYIATVSQQGVPARTAISGLQGALEELRDPASDVAETFKALTGLSFDQFIANGGNLSDAFKLLRDYADEAGTPVTQLFANLEAGKTVLLTTGEKASLLAQNIDDIANSSTGLSSAWDAMSQTSQEKINQFKATWENIKIDVGGKLVEALQPVLDWIMEHKDEIGNAVKGLFDGITSALDWVVSNWGTVKIALEGIGAAIAAWTLIKAASWIEGLIGGLSSLGGLLSPTGLLMLGVAALAVGLGKARDAVTSFNQAHQEAIDKASNMAASMAELENSAEGVAAAAQILQGAIDLAGNGLISLVNNGDMSVITLGEITDKLGELREQVLTVPVEEMAQKWADGVGGILSGYEASVPGIAAVTENLVAAFGEAGTESGKAFVEAASGAVDENSAAFQDSGEGSAGQYAAGIEGGAPAVADAASGMVDGAIGAVDEAQGGLVSAIEKLTAAIETTFGDVIDAAKEMSLGVADEVGDLGVVGFDAGTDFGGGVADGIDDTSPLAQDAAFEIGHDTALGTSNGILSGIPAVESAATDMATVPIDTAVDVLEIQSPSRVMAEIGENIPAGLADGIDAGAPEVESAMQKILDKLREDLEDAWGSIKSGTESALSDAFMDFLTMGETNAQAEEDYQDAKDEIEEELAGAAASLKEKYDEDLAALKESLNGKKIAQKEYNQQAKELWAEYQANLAEANAEAATELGEAEADWQEHRVTVGSILAGFGKDVVASVQKAGADLAASQIMSLLFGGGSGGGLFSGLSTAASGAESSLGSFFGKVGGWLKDLVTGAGAAGSTAGGAISAIGSGVADLGKTVAGSAGKGILSFLVDIGTKAISGTNVIGTAFSAAGVAVGALGKEGDKTSAAIGLASSVIGTTLSAFSGNVAGVISGVVGIFKTLPAVWDDIKKIAGNVWNGIVGAVKSAWDGITGFFEGIWETAKKGWTKFWDWVTGKNKDKKAEVEANAAPAGGGGTNTSQTTPASGGGTTSAEQEPDTYYSDTNTSVPVTGGYAAAEASLQAIRKYNDQLSAMQISSVLQAWKNKGQSWDTLTSFLSGLSSSMSTEQKQAQLRSYLQSLGVQPDISIDDMFGHGYYAPGPAVVGDKMVGDLGPEALLPLTQSVLRDIGAGIADSVGAQPTQTQINWEGLFKGATFHVRTDSDVELIARKIYDLMQERKRGLGWVAA
ncbi:MAG: phage tail tape measure protein [Actinomycetia bacterium]|nr:phage tail tape measure protein [Actinomycetes bacterium]